MSPTSRPDRDREFRTLLSIMARGIRLAYPRTKRASVRRVGLALLVMVSARMAFAQPPSPPRFAVGLSDGQRWIGQRLTDWNSPGTEPQLDSRPLTNAQRSWTWIGDHKVKREPEPVSFLEMHQGDRLPGIATQAARVGNETRWLVRPRVEVRPPGAAQAYVIRVPAHFVRRVVWQRQVTDYEPGLVIHRDGRRWHARSLQLGDNAVRLLTSDGIEAVSYSELAELHGPESDPWAMIDTLRSRREDIPPADASTQLVHWVTGDGLRVTASENTFQIRPAGKDWESEAWIHGLKPVWSDQTLWVRGSTLAWRQRFSESRIPLTILPVHTEEGSAPRCHTTARGTLLAPNLGPDDAEAGDRGLGAQDRAVRGPEAGYWGWGVAAPSRFSLPLPANARALHVGYGLDRIARSLGAARGQLRIVTRLAPQSSQLLLDVSIDGETPAETDRRLSWPALPADARLVWEVGPEAESESPAAAPGAIADFWDWLEPTLELAPVADSSEP